MTGGFPGGSVVGNPPANAGDWGSVVGNHLPMQETGVHSLGQKNPLEEEMATHSSILDWEIPRTEEPGGLQSMGLQRVRHDLASKNITL